MAVGIPVLTLARNVALHTATSIPEISLPPFPRNNFTQKIFSPTHAICKDSYEYARRHVENFKTIFAVEK
jgi:hypothetical protein